MDMPADWDGDCCFGCGGALGDIEEIQTCEVCDAKACLLCGLVTEGMCRECSAKSVAPPDDRLHEEVTPPVDP